MAFLNVIDGEYVSNGEELNDYEFEQLYFKNKTWDAFQYHAYNIIKHTNDNVLITAPTSSGKTMPAKYAILFHLLVKHKRVVYTTPIKSLSNEKYDEMKTLLEPFGIQPGLVTGDHNINADSMFLIMTAEILANSLFVNNQTGKSLSNDVISTVGCVIIDEIHYISDANRGYVWESTLIMLNRDIQIIGLSATIDAPEEFANWIGSVKKKTIHLIKKYDRPVPLEYGLFDGTRFHQIADSDGKYNHTNFSSALVHINEFKLAHKKKHTDYSLDMLNKFVEFAKTNNLLQLGFIIFSKKNCEKFASQVKCHLLDALESHQAIRALDTTLGIYLKDFQTMPRYRQLRDLIGRGICFHHAGLPVILKEAVEHLFKSGHIKVLFATETIAVGVNMPIRTMVFVSLERNLGQTVVPINSAEFKQMCGRAGRRGIDTKGTIVILPLHETPNELHLKSELLFGSLPKIRSTMKLDYHIYLKLLQINKQELNLDTFYEQSLLSLTLAKQTDLKSTLAKSDEKKILDLEENLSQIIREKNLQPDTVAKVQKYHTVMNKDYGNRVHVKLGREQQKQFKSTEAVIKKHPDIDKLVREITVLKNSVEQSVSEITESTDYKTRQEQAAKMFLQETQCLTENGCTDRGTVCSMINECNPFLLADIIGGGIIDSLSPQQIVCVLSLFVEPNREDEIYLSDVEISEEVKQSINKINQRISYYKAVERALNISNDDCWKITYDFLEMAWIWTNVDLKKEDHGRILSMLNKYECYEGLFIKNMLKINNIVDNMITICNTTGNLEYLPKLQEITDILIKGFVNANSLHVK